jgi:hypothetical protein
LNSTQNLVNSLNFELLEANSELKFNVVFDEENYFVNSIIYLSEILKQFDENGKGIILGILVRHVCSVMALKKSESFEEELNIYFRFLTQIYSNEDNSTTLNMYFIKAEKIYPISPIFNSEGNFLNFVLPSILHEW